jgi:hypothetical protein
MKKLHLLGLSVVLLASAGIVSNASAQEKTRAQVRQELIQAEVDGSGFVTDASYSGIAPVLAQQAARLKPQYESETGTEMSGSSAVGRRSMPARTGPITFCTPFCGS